MRKCISILVIGFLLWEFVQAQELLATRLSHFEFAQLAPEDEARFRRLQLSVQSQVWSDALPVLARFAALDTNRLIPVVAETSEEKTMNFSSVGSECGNMARKIPNEFLPEWQSSTGTVVETLLGDSDSRFPPSRETLHYILTCFPNSAYELECLEMEGQLEWERGYLRNAVQAWQKELECRKKWEENESQEEFRTFRLKKLPSCVQLEARLTHFEGAENAQIVLPASDWVATMVEIQDPESGVLFEDFMIPEQRGTLFESRVSDETLLKRSAPSFACLTPDNARFVARMGTRVTRWPVGERDTRPHAYLVALDVHSEGRLLWIRMPDTAQWAFVGNPVVSETCVYMTSVKWAEKPEFFLDVYSTADGSLKYRTVLFSAVVPENCREIFLPIHGENQTIFVGGASTGMEMVLDVSPCNGNICAPLVLGAKIFDIP